MVMFCNRKERGQAAVGLVCSAGFDFEDESLRLITGDDLYELRES